MAGLRSSLVAIALLAAGCGHLPPGAQKGVRGVQEAHGKFVGYAVEVCAATAHATPEAREACLVEFVGPAVTEAADYIRGGE